MDRLSGGGHRMDRSAQSPVFVSAVADSQEFAVEAMSFF